MSAAARQSMVSACAWCLALAATAPVEAVIATGTDATIAAAQATPAPVPRLRHPQVSMAGFSREYRVLPMHSSPADERIRRALRQPTPERRDFQETPLRAVLARIQDDAGEPVVTDWSALEDAGIDVDAATVTHAVPAGMSLGAALRLVLRDCGLTWITGDGVLMVTTKERAQERPIVVTYPLPRGVCDVGPPDFQATINLIQSVVAAHSWDVVGGAGSIKPLEAGDDPLLVVSQTCEVHEEIEGLLRGIHERLLTEFAGGKPVVRVHHVAADGDRAALAESLKGVCNEALGSDGDADAAVTVVGDGLVVRSKSPEFHALAAQVVAAVAGVPGVADPSPPVPGLGIGLAP